MKTIQIINLDGKPVAIAVDGIAHVAEHVAASQLQRVQAKALYALRIEAGEIPGPYDDAAAERYADHAADVRAALTARMRARRRRRAPHAHR